MYQQRNKAMADTTGSVPKKYKHYVHSPFTLNLSGLKVTVDDTGKITLTQDHGNEEFDEITTSASLINRIVVMLGMSPQFELDHWGVKVKTGDKGEIIITQDHPDDTFDEIITTSMNINNILKMLQSTRKVVYKTEKFGAAEENGVN